MRGRAYARDGLTPIERAEQARRARARAHLASVRAHAERGPSRPTPLLAALLLLAGAFGAGHLCGELRVGSERPLRTIAVCGARRLAPEEVARRAGVAPGTPLARVDAKAVAAAIAADPRLAGARAVRLPTGGLVIGIRERRASAAVELGEPARLYAVDAAGVPFDRASVGELERLPRLVSADAPAPGVEHAGMAAAVALAERFSAVGLDPPAEVFVAAEGDPDGFAVRIPPWRGQFVLGREDPGAALGRLALLLAADLPEVVGAARIDLRFEGQAVLGGTAGG